MAVSWDQEPLLYLLVCRFWSGTSYFSQEKSGDFGKWGVVWQPCLITVRIRMKFVIFFCGKKYVNGLNSLLTYSPKRSWSLALQDYFLVIKYLLGRKYCFYRWSYCDFLIDIDECDLDNGNCQEVCNNTLGSFECDCRTGFTLQPDGRTCRGTIHAQKSRILPLKLQYCV